MSWLRAFGRFWYELIIGDDWKIAANVVITLGLATALLFSVGATWWWPLLAAALVIAGFMISVLVDARPQGRHDSTSQ
jgi:hypothetical protein